MKNLSTLLASLMHFCVDALCLCCLYLTTGNAHDYLVYNVLAFLTQPLTGIIVDKINGKYNVLFSAVILFLMATSMAVLTPDYKTVIAVLLGAGNSLFHVWGGREVAIVTKNDIRALGIFVSPGVLGLAVGAFLCSWMLLFALLIAIGILTTIHFCIINGNAQVGSDNHLKTNKMAVLLMIAICVVVMLRSYLAGGFLARLAGSYMTAFVIFVVASVACLVAKNYVDGAVFVGLFAVNCTMPVTLHWAEKLLPGREGFSFGLLAASLMPPYLLSYL